MSNRGLSAASLLLGFLLVGCDESPNEQRVIAIGDIHADIGAARAAFELAGAIDKNDAWIGGNLIIVQLGDVIGRSYDEREVLDFVLSVREQAEGAGGKVHILVGNHEVFGAQRQLRWVADEAYAGFDDILGLELDAPDLAELPPNKRARSAALSPGGHYASSVASFPVVLQMGETIFVHGGVTPYWAEYGVDRINEEVSRWFAGEIEQPPSALGWDPRNDDDNVMMSRHFSEAVGEKECAMLNESLRILGAKRMIVAHTVQETITSFCDEKVWAIDVGMSRYYGGNVEVLELINDEVSAVLHGLSPPRLRGL
jgi:hypothetical protein